MPALRIISEEGGERPAGPQTFAQQPHLALETLSPIAYRTLGAILFYHRPTIRAWIDATDADLAERIKDRPSRGQIQRGLAELRSRGWIGTVRTQGRRKIYPLWDRMDVAPTVHACSAGATPL